METGKHPEPGAGWGEGGEDLARLQRLLELVRREQQTELTPERREQIRARVLERLERYRSSAGDGAPSWRPHRRYCWPGWC